MATAIWISLGNDDNELRIFLNYLHIAIENAIPGTVTKFLELIQGPELPPMRVISETLLNDMDEIEENFILVLDDYHLINDEDIHELIDALLRFPPQNMHLVMVSRRDPPLSLNYLRANSRMNEIRMHDLSFTESEVVSLFNNMFGIHLSEEVIKQLLLKTEGWIVGLRLASLIIDKVENKESLLQNLDGDIYTISEFLLEEVLMKQANEIQSFILATSILNRFCVELIDELQIKPPESKEPYLSGREFLEWLIDQNLFIISLDDQNKWFRYHHLFQELLQNLLTQKMPQEIVLKHHRNASLWFEKQELVEEALEHKLAAGDELAAIKLIEKYAHQEFVKGVFRIRKWLDSIPEHLRHKRPKILLIEAWQAFGQFQLEKIPALLEKAEILLEGKDIEPQLQAEIDFFHGNFQYWTGDTASSIKTLKQALSYTDNLPAHIHGNIELILNMALQRGGHYEMIIARLQQELRGLDRSGGYQFTYTYGSLVFSHLLQGKLQQSIEAAHQWANHSTKLAAHYFLGWSNYLQAGANFHMFKLDKALDHIKLTYDKRYILDLRASLDNMAIMTFVYHFKNEPTLVGNTIQNMVEFARNYNDPLALLVSRSVQARCQYLHGDLIPAMQWAESFEEEVDFSGMFFWNEVPWITRAKILVANGTEENLITATQLLEELLEVSVSSNLLIHIPEIKILLALVYQKQGKSDQSLRIFEEALILASTEEMIRPFIEAGDDIRSILETIRAKNQEIPFIETLIKNIDQYSLDKKQCLVKSSIKEAEDKEFTKELSGLELLTIRENEIVGLVAEGLRNKEIASKLFVSEITVKKHLSNIFKKMEVKNRITLINKAKDEGLIEA